MEHNNQISIWDIPQPPESPTSTPTVPQEAAKGETGQDIPPQVESAVAENYSHLDPDWVAEDDQIPF